MFSLNPFPTSGSLDDVKPVDLKNYLSEFKGNKVVLSDKLLTDYSFLLATGQDTLSDANWHIVTVCFNEFESESGALLSNSQIFSVEESYGSIPPFTPLKSFCIHQILKDLSPDIVMVIGSPSLAYFSLLSAQQGGGLVGANFILLNPEAKARTLEEKRQMPSGRTDIELNAMETAAYRLYDFVVDDRNDDFYRWSQAAGWANPIRYLLGDKFADVPAISTKDAALGDVVDACKNGPLISVCLTSCNRPDMLSEALHSLDLQKYKNFEVLVVDDGSDVINRELIVKLETKYKKYGWRFFYQENKGPGAARNYAASIAKGTHVLFMDDDNWALSNELLMFAKAAVSSNADIYTCIPGWHPKSELPSGTEVSVTSPDDNYEKVYADWLPLGGHAELGVFINCFGDTNALYKKSTFLDLGGYDERREYILEDMEFFSRAVNIGYQLEVIPEVLFLYRKHGTSRTALEAPIFSSHINTLHTYSSHVSPKIWSLLLCLRKGFHDRHSLITNTLIKTKDIKIGEWVEVNDQNPKVDLVGFTLSQGEWGLQKGSSELTFTIPQPGRNNSLLFECRGRKLSFYIGESEYITDIADHSYYQLVECRLHPGALNTNGETRLIFGDGSDVLIRRFAVMQAGKGNG